MIPFLFKDLGSEVDPDLGALRRMENKALRHDQQVHGGEGEITFEVVVVDLEAIKIKRERASEKANLLYEAAKNLL